ALPHRVRTARLGPHADRLRLSEPQRLQAAVGPGPARHRPQPFHLSPLAERADHRTVRSARSDERAARLFRAAALASRPAAEAEGVAKGPERVELLGYHADRRDAQIEEATTTTRAGRIDAPPTGRRRWRRCVGMRCARSARRCS